MQNMKPRDISEILAEVIESLTIVKKSIDGGEYISIDDDSNSKYISLDETAGVIDIDLWNE